MLVITNEAKNILNQYLTKNEKDTIVFDYDTYNKSISLNIILHKETDSVIDINGINVLFMNDADKVVLHWTIFVHDNKLAITKGKGKQCEGCSSLHCNPKLCN